MQLRQVWGGCFVFSVTAWQSQVMMCIKPKVVFSYGFVAELSCSDWTKWLSSHHWIFEFNCLIGQRWVWKVTVRYVLGTSCISSWDTLLMLQDLRPKSMLPEKNWLQQAICALKSLPTSLSSCCEAPFSHLTISMFGFKQVENLEDGSELEADVSFQMKRSTLKKTAVALATAMVVCVGIFALSTNGFSRSCSNVGALQGKSSLDLNSAIRSTSEKLIQATKNNQTLADETVLKAMVKAGRKVQDHWEKHHIRKLDTLMTIRGWKDSAKDKRPNLLEWQNAPSTSWRHLSQWWVWVMTSMPSFALALHLVMVSLSWLAR